MSERVERIALGYEGWQELFTPTRDHVARLRARASAIEAVHDDPEGDLRDEMELYEQFRVLYDLADRIEALLPPEAPA